MFIFYVWLCTFLLGWTSMSAYPIKHCEKPIGENCVYRSLCVYCDNEMVHNVICAFDMLVCFFYMFWTSIHLWYQCVNYGRNETTYERFAKKKRNIITATEDDSFDESG